MGYKQILMLINNLLGASLILASFRGDGQTDLTKYR
jgi:hypothetical protein